MQPKPRFLMEPDGCIAQHPRKPYTALGATLCQSAVPLAFHRVSRARVTWGVIVRGGANACMVLVTGAVLPPARFHGIFTAAV